MQTYKTEAIRNVVLLSHSGAGKTSLSEAMLFNAGHVTRLGKVEDGNTTSDYEPEEVRRAGSVQLSILPFEWNDTKVNLIDTPGYADFIGEVIAALKVADSALLVICAGLGDRGGDGVDVGGGFGTGSSRNDSAQQDGQGKRQFQRCAGASARPVRQEVRGYSTPHRGGIGLQGRDRPHQHESPRPRRPGHRHPR